jgi:hypothetical protein
MKKHKIKKYQSSEADPPVIKNRNPTVVINYRVV